MWYDLFSTFYDRALEDLYLPHRDRAIEALHLTPGAVVLDLPCGTGQSFPGIMDRIGSRGALIGVDRSRGMLRQARRRVQAAGWKNVDLLLADARHFDAHLAAAHGQVQSDAALFALGLTALRDWEQVVERVIRLVRPGGRIAVLDVYAQKRTTQTRAVEFTARADLSRRVWEHLAPRLADFERTVMSHDVRRFGGELYLAAGTVEGRS